MSDNSMYFRNNPLWIQGSKFDPKSMILMIENIKVLKIFAVLTLDTYQNSSVSLFHIPVHTLHNVCA
jgi:hypothetical protein